jgi:hypothetical protein
MPMSLWFVDMNHRVKNPGRSWSCPDSVASAMVVSCSDVFWREPDRLHPSRSGPF